MRESGIGRVLVASLHQAISDVLPTRLGFYEGFLNPEGLRVGTIGPAPLSAVLSFLRQDRDAYDRIVTRAGEYAAEWTVESMTPMGRSMIRVAPAWLRARLVLRVAGRLVRHCYDQSRATSRVRRRTARVELHGSIFCAVRVPVRVPLCGFYAAAVARLLVLFELPASASIAACRGTGATPARCVLEVSLTGTADARVPEETAA